MAELRPRTVSRRASQFTPRKCSLTFSNRMSAFLPPTFQLTADAIAEPVFRSAVGDVIEKGAAPQFFEGQSAVQPVILVERSVQPTVDEHAPVETPPAMRQAIERRRTIRAQAVIPARLFIKAIDGFDVIEKSVS